MTTKDVLIAAKALIDTPDKWCKGRLRNAAGQMCAAGALEASFTKYHEFEAARDALVQATDNPSEFWAISAYNDEESRSHADVMAWFDRAIESVS